MDERHGLYQDAVVEFLQSSGGAGILLTVDTDEGTTHNEFVSQTHVSRATVTKRIQEAEALDLIAATRYDDDHGNTKRFFLTQIGRVYRVALESMGLGETYRTYVDAKQSFSDGIDEIGEWIIEHEYYWTDKNVGAEFQFEDGLKDADIYPGDDVRSDFESFIRGEISYHDFVDGISEPPTNLDSED